MGKVLWYQSIFGYPYTTNVGYTAQSTEINEFRKNLGNLPLLPKLFRHNEMRQTLHFDGAALDAVMQP